MSSGLISELDHQLTDLAHLIMAPREITLPYVMAQLECDQEEANARLDHWGVILSNSMFIPQSWALH
jgi:hypothetical protein